MERQQGDEAAGGRIKAVQSSRFKVEAAGGRGGRRQKVEGMQNKKCKMQNGLKDEEVRAEGEATGGRGSGRQTVPDYFIRCFR
jgi:hypothetical protein